MDPFLLPPLAIVVLVTCVSLVVAFTRKGSVATVGMTSRRIVLYSAAPPEVLFAWLTQYCPAGYSIEDADPAHGIVLFSSRPTLFTWGFFYPAALFPQGSGTHVHLGIKSKLFQYGPLVTRAHRKLANALAGLTQSQIVQV